MKTNKHTVIAIFLTLLLSSVSVVNFLRSDIVEQARGLAHPAPSELFYSMQLPFNHGTMFTDRIEQVIINQYSESSKSFHQFNSSNVREIRNLQKSVQYISLLSQTKLRPYDCLNCVLLI